MPIQYDPWKFVELYETELGLELWKFLCLPANIVRAETAIDLRRTSVEALERPLNERFEQQFQLLIDEDIAKGEQKFLRLKQMIGHMVGQIMASRGYVKDKQGVILPIRKQKTDSPLKFTKATRFKNNDL
jgi:hypothetical protein